MSEAKYDLSYKGELLEGFYADFVKADLKNLFKASDDYIERLFSGNEQVIKRDVDKPTAIKFQQAFKKAGAKLIVRPAGAAANQASPTTSPPKTALAKPTPHTRPSEVHTGSFSLINEPQANEGADDLVEHHQPDLTAPSAIPNWSVAQAGTTLLPAKPDIAPSVKAPNLDVAPAGADLLADKPADPAPPKLDLSGFDLAEPGADIETLATAVAPREIDISHIKLTD